MRSSPTDNGGRREGGRRRSWGLLMAVVLLLLLLLCCGLLLWPVPSEDTGRASRSGRSGQASRLAVEVIDISVADVSVGTKGYAVVFRLGIRTRDAERRLDLNHFALEIDNVSLPPVPVTEAAGRLHVIPATVPSGQPVEAAVVFAVPHGASGARLLVNMPDVPADGAVSLDVVLPAEESR